MPRGRMARLARFVTGQLREWKRCVVARVGIRLAHINKREMQHGEAQSGA